jgi:hypothetical protein
MPPLTYSQLVIIRVTHEDPTVTRACASALRQELSPVLEAFLRLVPLPGIRPKLEVLAVGSEDFPMKEGGHPC